MRSFIAFRLSVGFPLELVARRNSKHLPDLGDVVLLFNALPARFAFGLQQRAFGTDKHTQPRFTQTRLSQPLPSTPSSPTADRRPPTRLQYLFELRHPHL